MRPAEEIELELEIEQQELDAKKKKAADETIGSDAYHSYECIARISW